MPVLTLMLSLVSAPVLGVFSGLLSDVTSWMLVVFGIGLVIFVHEAGHFLVAKWCGVRCEVFSLGFGTRLFGFYRGGTDYRISLVPIGGYVKMAGDNPGENLQGASDELPSKSVGQRFAIYSAGVVMNVIFAMIVLPLVLAVGVMFNSTEVGAVSEGGAAWRAGLRSGDDLKSVGGSLVLNFPEVVTQVALGDTENLTASFLRPGETEVREVILHPTYDEEEGRYVIGIGPSLAQAVVVRQDGPAAKAGLDEDDVVVVSFAGTAVESVAHFMSLCRENVAETVAIVVRNEDGEERALEVEAESVSDPERRIGIQPFVNRVLALRGVARQLLGDRIHEGDDLQTLWIHDGDDPVASRTAEPKPLRNREEFEEAFGAVWETSVRWTVGLRRDGDEMRVEIPRAALTSQADLNAADLTNDIAFGVGDDQNKVWLYRRPNADGVVEYFPCEEAGVPEMARILEVGGERVTTWTEITKAIRDFDPDEPVVLLVDHDGASRSFEVTPKEVQLRPDVGLQPEYAMIERRYGIGEAFHVGAVESAYFLKTVYLTLKKIFIRDVSPKNLSGILTIAVVSKKLADAGIPRLFFFLSILSLNLAFLNVLPIPVLDGGHLLFLLVEKIKGSPVSERVMGYSQLVGLVMVFALLLYVTYNDIIRVFVKN